MDSPRVRRKHTPGEARVIDPALASIDWRDARVAPGLATTPPMGDYDSVAQDGFASTGDVTPGEVFDTIVR